MIGSSRRPWRGRSPRRSGILPLGAGASIGILAGGGRARRRRARGCSGGRGRVVAAIPRAPADARIDPFTLAEPWRRYVTDALQARHAVRGVGRRAPARARCRTGCARSRSRVDTGVQEVWRIARRGHDLVDARRRVDPDAIRRDIAATEAHAGQPWAAGSTDAAHAGVPPGPARHGRADRARDQRRRQPPAAAQRSARRSRRPHDRAVGAGPRRRRARRPRRRRRPDGRRDGGAAARPSRRRAAARRWPAPGDRAPTRQRGPAQRPSTPPPARRRRSAGRTSSRRGSCCRGSPGSRARSPSPPTSASAPPPTCSRRPSGSPTCCRTCSARACCRRRSSPCTRGCSRRTARPPTAWPGKILGLLLTVMAAVVAVGILFARPITMLHHARASRASSSSWPPRSCGSCSRASPSWCCRPTARASSTATGTSSSPTSRR